MATLDAIESKWRSCTAPDRAQYKRNYKWCSLFEVSYRGLEAGGPLEAISMVYSAVIWPLAWLLLFLAGLVVDFMFAKWAIYAFIVHEISRKVIKPRFRQLRPSRSLAWKCWGFPSNHACVSTLLFVLATFHVVRLDQGTSPTAMMIACLLVWPPVLPARVILGDHTWTQVGAGAVLGALGAFLWLALGL